MAKMKYGSHPGYEPTDAHFGPIVKFTMWLSVSTAVALVGSIGLLEAMREIPGKDAGEPHPLAAKDPVIPAAPHLEAMRGIAWNDRGGLVVKAGDDGAVDQQAASEQYVQGGDPQTVSPYNTYMWRDYGRDARSRLGEPIDAFKSPVERAKDWTTHSEGGQPAQRDSDGYGWVDRNGGVAHIPLSRATELVLQKGLPHTDRPKD